MLLLVELFTYGYLRARALYREMDHFKTELASTTSALSEKADAQKVVSLSDQIYTVEHNVQAVQTRLGGFESTVGAISSTVGTLDKLRKLDPELLQKYSKVYFLNEHYVPEQLTVLDMRYLYSENRMEKVHTQVLPHLQTLLQSATSSGITLYIKSAYRSFYEQASLKTGYSVTYGAGTANKFSAEQGYSEHQLGTTVDFITTGTGGQLAGFDKTPASVWLLENAYKYGFILSYPKGNTYYIFEPWHWRYVGVKLATFLHDQNKNFYDLEQREIDTYLINIFD